MQIVETTGPESIERVRVPGSGHPLGLLRLKGPRHGGSDFQAKLTSRKRVSL